MPHIAASTTTTPQGSTRLGRVSRSRVQTRRTRTQPQTTRPQTQQTRPRQQVEGEGTTPEPTPCTLPTTHEPTDARDDKREGTNEESPGSPCSAPLHNKISFSYGVRSKTPYLHTQPTTPTHSDLHLLPQQKQTPNKGHHPTPGQTGPKADRQTRPDSSSELKHTTLPARTFTPAHQRKVPDPPRFMHSSHHTAPIDTQWDAETIENPVTKAHPRQDHPKGTRNTGRQAYRGRPQPQEEQKTHTTARQTEPTLLILASPSTPCTHPHTHPT